MGPQSRAARYRRAGTFRGAAYTRNLMYEAQIVTAFRAAHAVTIAGRPEESHVHDWTVRVVVEAHALDADGLVVDFHRLQSDLAAVLAPWQGADLNQAAEFVGRNPSAEAVAESIARALQGRLGSAVAVRSVQVTEAPGCAARFVCSAGAIR